MVNFTYPVKCPLLGGKEIEAALCFNIHMVVAGEAPKRCAPDEIYTKQDYVSTCYSCKYHRND